MPSGKATCVSCANIALIKYWGNRNDALRLPMTNSISFNLDGAQTTTTVEFRDDLTSDEIELDGARTSGASAERISRHLDLLRTLVQTHARMRIVSCNNFPMGAGIASSASGFAALTCAAAWALGLDLSERELSRLARRGSGSAARSVPGGFVEWYASDREDDSFAETLAPAEHWPLHDLVAIVARGEKSVGSTEGHALAHTSPLHMGRIEQVEKDLPLMRRAILEKDLHTLGEFAERDTLMMHAKAPHPNAARLFYAYMFSKDTQQMLIDFGGLRSVRVGMKEPANRVPISRIRLLRGAANAVLQQSDELKTISAHSFRTCRRWRRSAARRRSWEACGRSCWSCWRRRRRTRGDWFPSGATPPTARRAAARICAGRGCWSATIPTIPPGHSSPTACSSGPSGSPTSTRSWSCTTTPTAR